jgi:ATP-dependent Clp protease ATP-binding subunit ClpC
MSPNSSRIRWNIPPQNEPPQDEIQRITQIPSANPESGVEAASTTPLLDQIGRDLTQLAREGRLKPLFGRQKELRQLQRILLRKQKNNPLLVGAPGVGKTVLVEGLAIIIAQNKTIEELKHLRIVEISSGSLVSGTTFRGAFEAKLQELITEASRNENLVLFIDEIHTMVKAGAVEGGALDAANMLKPALAEGDLHCIGATTSDEFDQFIHSDPAFERRFEPLILEEPTESETIEILKAAIPAYETHHHVHILPEAVEAAVKLSEQNILDRRLPDKAFDLLDTACTYIRLPDPGTLHPSDPSMTVDDNIVSLALADKLNIPVQKLDQDFKTKLSGIEEFLNQHVFGQPIALGKIASAIINAFSGLGNPCQPKQVFAFFGSSGVGKTATAKALAEFLFDSPDAMIRLDMSEYKEAQSISRLWGSPPGYVGYDDEGTFATRLRRQPFSVVLLDEIEKAHPEIHDAYLQIFDEGRFTDTHGRLIDARHAIFILTSNLYTVTEVESVDQYEQQIASIRQSLNGYFRPEFVNRISEIVLFKELSTDDLASIAQAEILSINDRLSRYQVVIHPSDEALKWIAKESYDPNSGARSVSRVISREISEPISNQIIKGELKDGQNINLAVEDEKLVFKYQIG